MNLIQLLFGAVKLETYQHEGNQTIFSATVRGCFELMVSPILKYIHFYSLFNKFKN